MDDVHPVANMRQMCERAAEELVHLRHDLVTLPDEENGVDRLDLIKSEESAFDRRSRGMVAPHRVQRDARQLAFPRLDPLLAGVVPALVTHPVRSLHGATARAGLDRDGRGLLVRVAGALLPLGGTSLGDGHCRLR